MVSILFGLISAVVGAWGFWIWRAEFLTVTKGLLPLSLVLVGVVAVLMGFSGTGDRRGKN